MEAIPIVLMIGVLLAYGVFWVLMLREIAVRPDRVYQEAGESKGLWFLVVLVLQFFGTMAYFFWVRDKLNSAEKSLPA